MAIVRPFPRLEFPVVSSNTPDMCAAALVYSAWALWLRLDHGRRKFVLYPVFGALVTTWVPQSAVYGTWRAVDDTEYDRLELDELPDGPD